MPVGDCVDNHGFGSSPAASPGRRLPPSWLLRPSWLTRAILAAAILGPFVWCFGSVLWSDRGFAFRDAAHFYYPLFAWVNRQWAAGSIPLWNPQENCGLPVLADGTSSVFYPGKLVFALPWGYAWNFKLYTMLHVLLAAAAAFRLARRWSASRYAAGLAAVAYAFGGSVLFQYCNVVYLVGAAWLPLALAAAERMLVARSLRAALLLGAVLAVMVLGGDPQMAYHAGLLAAGYAWLLWRSDRRARRGATATVSPSDRQRASAESGDRQETRGVPRLVLLSLAAISAFALSAIQVLPSSEWSRHSERAAFRSPRSVYEIPSYLARDAFEGDRSSVARGLFGVPELGMHHDHIYQFSVGPWRLPEYVWPNFSGQMFPVHRRWASAIRAEGRVWTPSLYLGLVPLLLALSVWRVRGGPLAVRWLSWASLLATLASLGGYGLGWLLHEFRGGVLGAPPDDLLVGWPVGGLYWLLVVGLPGYAYFRYPAKLTVIAALALSQLAACGLDRLREREPTGLRRGTLGFVVLSAAAYLASLAITPLWSGWTGSLPPDSLYGPFDAFGALVGLRASLLHAVLLGGLVWWLLGEAGRRAPAWLAPALLLLTAADLSMSNGWMVLTAPAGDWQEPSRVAAAIADRESRAGDGQPFRVFRASRRDWYPEDWPRRSSLDRHRESFRWDRQTLYPKYHLENGLAVVEAYGSSAAYDYLAVLGAARRYGWRRPDGVREPRPLLMDALGVRYSIFPDNVRWPQAERIPLAAGELPVPDAALWRHPQAYPRAWIVHQVVTVPPLRHAGPDQVARRTQQVFFPGDAPYDLRETAVVEAEAKPFLATLPAASAVLAGEQCRIAVADPQRVVVQAQLQQPGLLVLSDLFYPGWTAEVASADGRREQVPILRTNRIMRGVALPAGTHRVEFVYRPASFYAGAVVSLCAWLTCGGAFLWLAIRRRLNPAWLGSSAASPQRPKTGGSPLVPRGSTPGTRCENRHLRAR